MVADWEERKLVTVLFADVTGSTSLGERLDPEEMRAILRRYFEVMSAAIAAWGGTVEKYVGDAVMAVFGVPTAREDDPARALRASLEMMSRLDELNEELDQRHAVRLTIRIGVNTGEVIAPTGADAMRQFLVSGDVVNVAARLEQAADPGTIVVGDRTWQLTRGGFRFDPPRRLEVRGKSEQVKAFRLREALAPGEVAERPLQAPMVGRDHELAALVGLFEETIETQQPGLAVVYGPAGIGKSRLMREFLDAATAARPQLQVLRGRCLAAGHGITFWALGDVLRACTGISLDDPGELARDRLRSGVARVLEPMRLPGEEVERATLALAATAGLPFPGNPLEDLTPEAVDEEMSRAWPLFASGLAAAAPTVIVVEDLHWADDRLVEMLARTTARAQGPFLLLATARPEFAESHPGFGTGGGLATAISLRPLTERQGGQLLAGLLEGAPLPDTLREDILARADGNPFFVEELIAGLVDQGVLVREAGGWRAVAPTSAGPLPDTVHAVLAARIDALPTQEKRALHEAAVIGRSFWPEPLARQLSDVDVGAALETLERRGLLVVRPVSSVAGQPEYVFKHQLVRDVAYAGVPKARRALAHAAAAAWTEELAGDRVDEFGELVAYHYRMALTGDGAELAWTDEPGRREEIRRLAFDALLRAGTAARHRYALLAAVELHRQAEQLADSDRERALALEAQGDDHAAVYHGDDALDALRRALELVRSDGDQELGVSRIAGKIGELSMRMGTFQRGPPAETIEAAVGEGLAVAREPEDRAPLLIAFANMGRLWEGSALGNLLLDQPRQDPVGRDQRLAAGREALEIARQLDDPALQARALMGLEDQAWRDVDPDAVAGIAQQLIDLEPRITSAQMRAEVLDDIAANRIHTGALHEALEIARRSLALSKELSPHEMMHASYQLMIAAFRLAQFAEVLELFEEHRAAAAREPDVTCSAVRGGPIIGALALVETGDERRARELVPLPDIAPPRIAAASFAGQVLHYAVALRELQTARELVPRLIRNVSARLTFAGAPEVVDALVAIEDWETLTAFLPLARSYARLQVILSPASDHAEAALLRARGDAVGASAFLRRAIQGFDAQAMPLEAARSREQLAALAPDEGRDLLNAALTAYREIGARPHVERVEAALAAA